MSLTRADFCSFFEAVNDGHRPFRWQQRLLDHVVSTGGWPAHVGAPTGAGKSNVVDVHVFANALYAAGAGPRVPRRMAVVVNRRALVDQHVERARHIAHTLDGAASGILGDVAGALRGLTGTFGPAVQVANLRGGVSLTRDWLEDPRACAVIAATPDMWGSRVLFRGYGSSRMAWPREAGLLAVDAVAVIDEAHLSRQLALTADRVALLAAQSASLGVPTLQVVSTTATPAAETAGASIGVTEDDLGDPEDALLRQRLCTPKPVRFHASSAWPVRGDCSAAYVQELARLARELRGASDGAGHPRTVGCVVNTVDTATKLAAELRSDRAADEVVLWVARMRPLDLEAERARRPELFTVAGDNSVHFLVATQTVEVGIDLDLAGMVTELAPGSALAQRFGRVNRLGRRTDPAIVVVGPQAAEVADRPPYAGADLTAARQWVGRLERIDGHGAPWNLVARPDAQPPEEALRRLVLSELQPSDAWYLAETSTEHFAEPDLAFWLRDSLEPDKEPVFFVVRHGLPDDDVIARALVEATIPDEREHFPCALTKARRVSGVILGRTERARLFLVRADEVTLHTGDSLAPSLRPGDVVVIDDGHPVFRSGVIDVDGDPEPVGAVWGSSDVEVILGSGEAPWLSALADADPEELPALAAERCGRPTQVTLPPEVLWEDGIPPWAVLTPEADVLDNPETRQEWSTSTAVLLDAHSAAVAARGRALGRELDLTGELVEAIRLAGLHHDAGKSDHRFQVERLGGDGRTLLAKGFPRHAQTMRRRARLSSLPARWRHEQASVVHAQQALSEGGSGDVDHRLVLRLVGTSHGRGRPAFEHGPASVGVPGPASDELFETGSGWSDVIDHTHERFGVWGCAYLEAVLRAADCAVSKEGS